jgi:hypothetical protein
MADRSTKVSGPQYMAALLAGPTANSLSFPDADNYILPPGSFVLAAARHGLARKGLKERVSEGLRLSKLHKPMTARKY